MAGSIDSLFRATSRNNGWECPWHILQVLAWAVIVYFTVIFFGIFAPSLVSPWDIVASVITAVIVAGLIVTMVIATWLDPADQSVRDKGGNTNVPKLDRMKHKHAIENQTCALCQVMVGPTSKHCSACNKCVSGFDHHCRWLNNCVGKRNYKWFFSCLVFGNLASLMVNILATLLLVAFFTDKDKGNIIKWYQESKGSGKSVAMKAFDISIEDSAFLALDIITLVLALLALFLLAHLTQFHVWLVCKGLSTYDYIIMQREKQRAKEESSLRDLSSPIRSQPLKANRIMPSKQTQIRPDCRDSKQYKQSLEKTDEIDGGETPPPQTSPIRDETLNPVVPDDSTVVRKMKRKKRKKLNSSDTKGSEKNLSTIDNPSLYQLNGHQHGSSSQESSQDGLNNLYPKSYSSNRRHLSSLDDESTTDLATSNGRHSRKLPALKRRMSDQMTDVVAVHQFEMGERGGAGHLSGDTNQTPSGGMNGPYSLTPMPNRKWQQEVPPLDFSALRKSTDSSNSFLPYTGTSRSYDTVRYPNEQKLLPALKALPEACSGSVVDEQ